MALIDTLRQLEHEIIDYAKEHTPSRGRKFKDNLKKQFGANTVQIALSNATVAAIELRVATIEANETLSNRFETIPKRFPSPNPNDPTDKLIYARFTLGYAVMADGRKASYTGKGIERAAGPSKYVSFALKKAQLKELNGDNFKFLCSIGFPQATHEYLYLNELRPHITDTQLLDECERLLAEYKY